MPDPTIILGGLILPPTSHLKSREVQFDEVVTGPPTNPTCSQYKSKLTIEAQMMWSLINIDGGYHLEISK
jgi:hypothetical protein